MVKLRIGGGKRTTRALRLAPTLLLVSLFFVVDMLGLASTTTRCLNSSRSVAWVTAARSSTGWSSTARQTYRSSRTILNKESKPQSPSPAAASAVAATRGGSSLLSFPKDHPFTFQLIVATVKTMAADLMTQMVAEGKSLSEVDWKRNGIFVVFGFSYLGGFQYWIMVNKYRQWFPTMDRFAKSSLKQKLQDTAGIIDAGKMVLFDIFIHLPLMYFPAYYTVKEFVAGSSYNPLVWVQQGVFVKYVANAREDLTAMVKLWGPSDCIQFVLPIHMRMPFRHLVSFFWTAYVSYTRGSIQSSANKE
jgi:hypothetical protein